MELQTEQKPLDKKPESIGKGMDEILSAKDTAEKSPELTIKQKIQALRNQIFFHKNMIERLRTRMLALYKQEFNDCDHEWTSEVGYHYRERYCAKCGHDPEGPTVYSV